MASLTIDLIVSASPLSDPVDFTVVPPLSVDRSLCHAVNGAGPVPVPLPENVPSDLVTLKLDGTAIDCADAIPTIARLLKLEALVLPAHAP